MSAIDVGFSEDKKFVAAMGGEEGMRKLDEMFGDAVDLRAVSFTRESQAELRERRLDQGRSRILEAEGRDADGKACDGAEKAYAITSLQNPTRNSRERLRPWRGRSLFCVCRPLMASAAPRA